MGQPAASHNLLKEKLELKFLHKSNGEKEAKKTFSLQQVLGNKIFSLCIKMIITVAGEYHLMFFTKVRLTDTASRLIRSQLIFQSIFGKPP